MSDVVVTGMAYFGKTPSRGDFVRSSQQTLLTQTLDRWSTQAIEAMAQDPHWRQIYDQALPMHFAFLGIRSHAVIAGHLIASADASGRRFPLIGASTFEVGEPQAFMERSPLALSPLWQRLQQATAQIYTASDAAPVLADIGQLQWEVEMGSQTQEDGYREFLELHTIGSLQAMLASGRSTVDVRRALLGLGQLLQPVPASGINQLDKGLRLPLPMDPLYRPLVATLWLDLIGRFLARSDFEVALFLPQSDTGSAAHLDVGLAGGAAVTLRAALDPQLGGDVFVDLSGPDWVEEQARAEYGVKKLSSYLEQPQLSLRQMQATFREAFLGE